MYAQAYLGGSVYCAPLEQQLLNLMLCEHLPWYFRALSACWKCGVHEEKYCFLRAKRSNTEGHQRMSFLKSLVDVVAFTS